VGTGRLEAFSDGVIAVIITIMVLELKVPHEPTWAALGAVVPGLLVYALSFAVVAIMWVNHHYLLAQAERPDPALLWSNVALLFWMSLIPFVTAYVADQHGAAIPVAAYAATLAVTSAGFCLLSAMVRRQSEDPAASARDYERWMRKGLFAIVLYAAAALLAFVAVAASYAIFVLVPVLYFLPDRKLADSA